MRKDDNLNLSYTLKADPSSKNSLKEEIIVDFPIEFCNNGNQEGIVSRIECEPIIEGRERQKMDLSKDELVGTWTEFRKGKQELGELLPIVIPGKKSYPLTCKIQFSYRYMGKESRKGRTILKILKSLTTLYVNIEYKVSSSSRIVCKLQRYKLDFSK